MHSNPAKLPTTTAMKQYAAWLPVFGYMGMIFALSSMPGLVAPDASPLNRLMAWTPPQLQNSLHIPLYAGLAWLWCRALALRNYSPGRVAAAAITLSIAYGALDEWHQTFVPGRTGSLTDLMLDLIGALLAAILFNRYQCA